MAQQSGKAKEISFIENASDVTLTVNGVRVEIHNDGSILAYTNGTVKVCPVANDDGNGRSPAEPKIGDKMLDGTIFAGISPETNKPMYATPADALLTMEFNHATDYAAKLDAHGHRDWRVPTKNELNILFNNRAAIGGFNVSGSNPAGWYWSATPYYLWYAWCQRFSDGLQHDTNKANRSSVRCVR